jgi:hypothetical protein
MLVINSLHLLLETTSETTEVYAGRVFEVFDGVHDEFDLLDEGLVLFFIHFRLVDQIEHDDLTVPHGLSDPLLLESMFLLAFIEVLAGFLLGHIVDDLVQFFLSCLSLGLLFEFPLFRIVEELGQLHHAFFSLLPP